MKIIQNRHDLRALLLIVVYITITLSLSYFLYNCEGWGEPGTFIETFATILYISFIPLGLLMIFLEQKIEKDWISSLILSLCSMPFLAYLLSWLAKTFSFFFFVIIVFWKVLAGLIVLLLILISVPKLKEMVKKNKSSANKD